tara:strand:+ start:696 stop:1388 length:693 start_codon:yes stop_codon:yes gene_type:complete
LNCLIVEDDEISRISLLKFCEKIDDLQVIGVCENVSQAIEYLQKNEIDLIFLDIELPGTTGLDLVKEMRDLPLIVFTTAKREYAADAFEYRDVVIDYITKPVSLPRILNAVNRAQYKLSKEEVTENYNDYLFVKSDGRLVRVEINDLEFIETVRDYVRFKTASSHFMVHSSLKSIDLKINHPDLMKIHRSYIINLSKIIDIQDNSVLIGKKIIPISRAHRTKLWKRLDPL